MFLQQSIFLSSSMAEHSAVNRVVVGSSPTWGAVYLTTRLYRTGCYFMEWTPRADAGISGGWKHLANEDHAAGAAAVREEFPVSGSARHSVRRAGKLC